MSGIEPLYLVLETNILPLNYILKDVYYFLTGRYYLSLPLCYHGGIPENCELRIYANPCEISRREQLTIGDPHLAG
jgi:hypothetical protein